MTYDAELIAEPAGVGRSLTYLRGANKLYSEAIISERITMTTVKFELPDDLAKRAQAAGILSSANMQQLVEEAVRCQASVALRTMWDQASPTDELTPEIEQMINNEVRAVRAECRAASTLVPKQS